MFQELPWKDSTWARLQKEQSKQQFSSISPILNSDNIRIYSTHFFFKFNVLFGIIFNEKKIYKEIKNKKGGVNGD